MELIQQILSIIVAILMILMSITLIIYNIYEICKSKQFWNDMKKRNEKFNELENINKGEK